MKTYYAGIQQSKDTITRFSRVQFNIFHKNIKLAVVGIAAALFLVGLILLTSQPGIAVILVFMSCIIFANQDAGADYSAHMAIDMFHGEYPKLQYAFLPSGFVISGNKEEYKYKSIIRLVEDESYLYLFLTEQYGFLIKASTVTGEDGLIGFKDFISKKTHLNWTRQSRLLSSKITTGLGLGTPGKAGIRLSGNKKMSVSELLFGRNDRRL